MDQIRNVNIGLIGLGTVGSGVVKILRDHQKDIFLKTGKFLNLKKIAEIDLKRKRPIRVEKNLITRQAKQILDDPEIDIVVELIGGIEPAKSYIIESIKKGKHVVTANKELLATHGKEIFAKARRKGVGIYFEASVGGGIPIIHPLRESLTGNAIRRIMGIVNGTTNYILTRMTEEGFLFKEALMEAKKKGYAEKNPSYDIEGKDSASKIAILSSIAFNTWVSYQQVYCEGISKITPYDILYADQMNYCIKLLALAQEENGQVIVRVHPAMISKDHPLASVKGVYNAIFVEGDEVGELMFYGQGAGSLPAGSAVVGDIVDAARNIGLTREEKNIPLSFQKKKIKSIQGLLTKYYILMDVVDRPGVLAKIAKIFGNNHVSIETVLQKQTEKATHLVFVMHLSKEREVQSSLEEIKNLNVVNKIINTIRVES